MLVVDTLSGKIEKAWEGSISLGPNHTSNTAEYGGLIFGLKKLEELAHLKLTKLRVVGDSLLVIQQCQRVIQCQAMNLLPLLAQVLGLVNKLPYPVEFAHCDRAFNTVADSLSTKGAGGLDTSVIFPHLNECTGTTVRSLSPPVSPLRGGGSGGGLKSFRDLRVALEYSAEQPPSASGEGSVALGAEGGGVPAEQKQQEQEQVQHAQLPPPQQTQPVHHQGHSKMALLVAKKKDYFKSLGVKQQKGRYPVKPQRQLRLHAQKEGWDAEKLARETAVLAAICDGIQEERAKLNAFVASKADALGTYNEWLVGYGLEPASSLTQGKKALSALFVCLFDLLEGNFRTFPTISSLRRYIKTYELYYPLQKTKGKAAAVFLKVVVM
jgi:hypothetical protein